VYIVDRVKVRLHRQIVDDPVIHGAVLNLYLNGEHYPAMVDDYFPIEEIDEPELVALMEAHLRDEERHVALYSKAIKTIEQPIVDLPIAQIFNHVVRRYTTTSFAIQPSDTKDERMRKLAHFFAHTHFIEKRVAKSLSYHVEACEMANSHYCFKAIGAILKDELRHVTYTREMVYALLPARAANDVLASHERAERRANLDFSSSELRRLSRERPDHLSLATRFLYQSCAGVLSRLITYA
jgi:hypothetical protein